MCSVGCGRSASSAITDRCAAARACNTALRLRATLAGLESPRMRSQTALLILSLATLASCATGPQPSCELATVPAGAVFGVREGIDIATYPPKMSPGVTGCQRVWYGERERPQAMNVMATYYYDKGVVRRLVGTVP